MINRRCIAAAGALLLAAAAWAAEPPAAAVKPRAIPLHVKEWKGDADGMIERRIVRVLVPYSRTLYYNDKGRERGLTADFARDLERFVDQKYRKQLAKRPVTVVLIPTTRDKLLGNVIAGLGDIAAGDLTATDERRKIVDFYVPAESPRMSEIVLTGPKSPPVGTADDLSGKTVHVRKSSSYNESLSVLNDRLKKAGKPAVNVVLVPDALEDEDMMEMLNVGMLQAIVVDDWLAKMWAQALPSIKINEGAVLRPGGQAGWAIRKGSPKLQELLAEFYVAAVKKVNPIAARMAQQSRRIKQLQDPTASEEVKRFENTIGLFRTYGAKYGFDPLMLAAQGYQESQLNQSVKSRVGAIGIMQVMPATGTELKVGDVHVAENNVHAGAKYMDILMTKYFTDAKFTDVNRSLFAFASYNAGPGGIARMRKVAASRGLDPDVWFNNVEIVTAEKLGMETPTYVRNIYKYYVSYRLMQDMADARKKAAESMKPGR
jgi:membrane-bound lytic murein transglycosylase MltF